MTVTAKKKKLGTNQPESIKEVEEVDESEW
jgi:hypothetical protein